MAGAFGVSATNPQVGVKRSLPGNPVGLPGALPAFRGRGVAPGGAIKAPKLANGNRPNEGSNVPLPYNRVAPLQFLSSFCGRLAPGDVAFVEKFPVGFMVKASTRFGGAPAMQRVVGLDGVNRLLHGASAPTGWRLGTNVFEGEAIDVHDGTKFLLPVLDKYRLDGVIKSNDEPGAFGSNGSRDAVIFNTVIKGPTLVNNGFLYYDPKSEPEHGVERDPSKASPLNGVHKGRTVNAFGTSEGGFYIERGEGAARPHYVTGSYDYVSNFTGNCTAYPAQMFDRSVEIGNTLYVGLQACELSTEQRNTLRNQDGSRLGEGEHGRFFYYQYVPFSNRRMWELERDPSVTEDEFDAIRKEDVPALVGAWSVGRVLDTKAMVYPWYPGGPKDTAHAMRVDVHVEWHARHHPALSDEMSIEDSTVEPKRQTDYSAGCSKTASLEVLFNREPTAAMEENGHFEVPVWEDEPMEPYNSLDASFHLHVRKIAEFKYDIQALIGELTASAKDAGLISSITNQISEYTTNARSELDFVKVQRRQALAGLSKEAYKEFIDGQPSYSTEAFEVFWSTKTWKDALHEFLIVQSLDRSFVERAIVFGELSIILRDSNAALAVKQEENDSTRVIKQWMLELDLRLAEEKYTQMQLEFDAKCDEFKLQEKLKNEGDRHLSEADRTNPLVSTLQDPNEFKTILERRFDSKKIMVKAYWGEKAAAEKEVEKAEAAARAVRAEERAAAEKAAEKAEAAEKAAAEKAERAAVDALLPFRQETDKVAEMAAKMAAEKPPAETDATAEGAGDAPASAPPAPKPKRRSPMRARPTGTSAPAAGPSVVEKAIEEFKRTRELSARTGSELPPSPTPSNGSDAGPSGPRTLTRPT
jgi:hypothetical protein